MLTIGVLAVQGAFIEHVRKLRRLGVEAREVRLPADLEGIDGLIIPGGESTTIGKLIDRFELREPILRLAQTGLPLWGTCAGMILLAREVDEDTRGKDQSLLGLMDLKVRRNAFGSQLDSFETDLQVPRLGVEPVPAVFIRAPLISDYGPDVEVIATLEDGRVVAVLQDRLLATAFHPELTEYDGFHQWFVSLVSEWNGVGRASMRHSEPVVS